MSKTKSATRKGAPKSTKSIEPGLAEFNASQKALIKARKDPNTIGFFIAVKGGSSVVINANKLDQEFSIQQATEIRDTITSCIDKAKANRASRLFAYLFGCSTAELKARLSK